jgi:hypothetical protein
VAAEHGYRADNHILGVLLVAAAAKLADVKVRQALFEPRSALTNQALTGSDVNEPGFREILLDQGGSSGKSFGFPTTNCNFTLTYARLKPFQDALALPLI